MVDVSEKTDTLRVAVAEGRVVVSPDTLHVIRKHQNPKGDVLSVAQIAGIQAAKLTSNLIPLCHPLQLTNISVKLSIDPGKNSVNVRSEVSSWGKTGVEMEALTATSVAALTVYDMIKAVDRTATIENIRLVEKHGGKSGDYHGVSQL